MRQSFILFLALGAALFAADRAIGYQATYDIAYGIICTIGLVIASTFYWLWRERATPLALGMAYSWAGASLVMGWWWVFALAGAPAGMTQNPLLFLFLAAYLVGAFMHLRVIRTTVGVAPKVFWMPLGVLVAIVIGIVLAT